MFEYTSMSTNSNQYPIKPLDDSALQKVNVYKYPPLGRMEILSNHGYNPSKGRISKKDKELFENPPIGRL